ncbi:MAG TPA: helix-turn-helix domain-containing protein [Steroidobacteraceae bacterium]|nr:helix-turn-helix domain-containing protein [Steroidobacteraceae bacterium]
MPQASRTSNPLVRLVDEVVRLQGRLKGVFAGSNEAAGLPPMELTVLTAVVEAASPPTVPQIGRSLGRPRQVIQRAAHALIAAQLIETAPNPHHKRAPLLAATRRGRAVKRKADDCAIRAANAFLGGIDAARCSRLARELRALRGEIEAYLRTQPA